MNMYSRPNPNAGQILYEKIANKVNYGHAQTPSKIHTEDEPLYASNTIDSQNYINERY